MDPDVSYRQLVEFVAEVAKALPSSGTSPQYTSGTGSQQLSGLVPYVQDLENRSLHLDRFIWTARKMTTHGGRYNGNVKPKTNTLTGK